MCLSQVSSSSFMCWLEAGHMLVSELPSKHSKGEDQINYIKHTVAYFVTLSDFQN